MTRRTAGNTSRASQAPSGPSHASVACLLVPFSSTKLTLLLEQHSPLPASLLDPFHHATFTSPNTLEQAVSALQAALATHHLDIASLLPHVLPVASNLLRTQRAAKQEAELCGAGLLTFDALFRAHRGGALQSWERFLEQDQGVNGGGSGTSEDTRETVVERWRREAEAKEQKRKGMLDRFVNAIVKNTDWIRLEDIEFGDPRWCSSEDFYGFLLQVVRWAAHLQASHDRPVKPGLYSKKETTALLRRLFAAFGTKWGVKKSRVVLREQFVDVGRASAQFVRFPLFFPSFLCFVSTVFYFLSDLFSQRALHATETPPDSPQPATLSAPLSTLLTLPTLSTLSTRFPPLLSPLPVLRSSHPTPRRLLYRSQTRSCGLYLRRRHRCSS